MHHVIIGGGIAGTTAAEELRKADPNAQITLIGEENHPVYSRVLLTPYIIGKVSRERIFLKKSDWYIEQKIVLLSGISVLEINPKNKFVALSDGRELEYDNLLITTGADATQIGEDLRGVSYLRTLDDADHLLRLLSERKENTHGAMYGGGFIACEYLNIFEHFQIPTTIAFRGPYFWSRVLDKESGEFLNEHLRDKGVEVIADAEFIELRGEKEIESLVTSKGEIKCGILGIGIGVASDLSLAKSAGIEIAKGILTNEYLETNIQGIYSAGDIAEFTDVIVGERLRIGTWLNAIMQGRAVGKTMVGNRTRFELISSYAAVALGLDIVFIGDTSRDHADEIIVRGSKKEGGVTQFFLKGGRLIGGTTIGRNSDRVPISKFIQSKQSVSGKVTAWKDIKNPIV